MNNIRKTGLFLIACCFTTIGFADIANFLSVNEEPFKQKIENAADHIANNPLIDYSNAKAAAETIKDEANKYLKNLNEGIGSSYKQRWLKRYIKIATHQFPGKTSAVIQQEAATAWDAQFKKAIKYMAAKLGLEVKK